MDNHTTIAAIVLGVVAVLFYSIPLWLHSRKQSATIEISFNSDIDKRYCCGYLWGVMNSDGGVKSALMRIPFAADKPELLVKPKEATIASIWASIIKAGINPITIEIINGSERMIYRYEAGNKPVFVYK